MTGSEALLNWGCCIKNVEMGLQRLKNASTPDVSRPAACSVEYELKAAHASLQAAIGLLDKLLL